MQRNSKWTLGLAAAGTLAIGLAACSSGKSPPTQVEPATMVLTNGNVVTMDAGRTVAQAIAIRGSTIVAVGSAADVEPYVGRDTQVVDLGGQTVLPGFIDAHVHPVLGAGRLGLCSMDGVSLTIQEIIPLAQACLASDSGAAGEWFQIVNVNPAGLIATKADLDQISTTRPVLMSGIDGHTGWVNTLGLQVAGITSATPDPVGGSITRDPSGEPTGALIDSAQDLVTAVIPPPTLRQKMEKSKIALALSRSKGITTLQDAVANDEAMDVYAALEVEGTLQMRVRADLHPGFNDIVDNEQVYAHFDAQRRRFADSPLIKADGVKIFSDGVIEYPTQSAAMIKPYLGLDGQPTTNYGGRYFDQATMEQYVARLDREGFRINVHSIGDFTTSAVLDAFEYARLVNGVSGHRHQISHLEIVAPADFPRFAELGVFANMQMFWALPDVYTLDALKPFIDPDTYRYIYPAKSLTAAGAVLVGGSDWPVDVFPDDPMPNTPLRATFMGVTRTNPVPGDPSFGQVLVPEEQVDRDTMLAAYTINAAAALDMEGEVGSIEVGKLADLVFFDVDVTTVPIEDLIFSVDVAATMLGGETVYQRPAGTARVVPSLARAAPGAVGVRAARSHAFCGHGDHRALGFHAEVTQPHGH